jgi:Phosphotransferase enzyme family
MSTVTEPGQTYTTTIVENLQLFAQLPGWLSAVVDQDRVRRALMQNIPEFASGELTLQDCDLKRVRVKKDSWTAMIRLKVAEPQNAGSRVVALRCTLIPPGKAEPTAVNGTAALGSDGWRLYLPELRLELEPEPADEALPTLPRLTDPEQARELLEQSIRAGSPAYPDLRIQSCIPRVMRYKPGSRCTILYRLQYGPDASDTWPDVVVAKTYQGDKGWIADEGMRKLWGSPLSKGDIVTIAEPLAYVPELKLLVQGPIREEQTLKELIRSALRDGTPEALEQLYQYMRMTAAGLAALHQSGAYHGETATWADEISEIREVIEQLGLSAPELVDAAAPLLRRLEQLDAQYPADPAVPTHRSFRPAQVLIHKGKIGFIDFDGFCQAEPALDVALFCATIKDIGLNTSPSGEEKEFQYPSDTALQARLTQVDAISEVFLTEYERLAPISRQRVALWETLDILTDVLHCWTKVKPQRLANMMALLERHLRLSEQLTL